MKNTGPGCFFLIAAGFPGAADPPAAGIWLGAAFIRIGLATRAAGQYKNAPFPA